MLFLQGVALIFHHTATCTYVDFETIPSLNLHHIAHLEEKEEGREENLISDIVIDGLYHFALYLCECSVGNVGILLEGNKLLLATCVGFVSL